MSGIESVYREVDSWDLPNGDRVVIVERNARYVPGEPTDPWVASYTWHIRAANNRKVGGGGETYVSKWNAKRAALRHHPRIEADQ